MVTFPRPAASLQVGAGVFKHKLEYNETNDLNLRCRASAVLEGRMPAGKTRRCAATLRGCAKRASLVALLGLAALCSTAAHDAPKSQGAIEGADRPAQTIPEPKVRNIAEQAVRRLDLQTELVREREPLGWQIQLPPEALWLVVVAGGAVLLYAFRDMIPVLRARRDSAWASEEIGGGASHTLEPSIALGAADALAAEGRFAEAMHVLLLHALAVIRRRLDEPFADSMTSREILRSRQLPDGLRAPLREVVGRVEWSYFGEHPAARDDYAACRSSFATLAQELHGAVAA
jgi:hypothetical protein